jgi:hypothetical protein
MFVIILGKRHDETDARILDAVRIEHELQLKDERMDIDRKIRSSQSIRRKLRVASDS